ncbi:hypothetical protein Hanom_Chr09g00858761 [Helianthus anomalus]
MVKNGLPLDTIHTFRWLNRVPLFIGAVIVDHMVQTDPSVPTGCNRIKLLVTRTLPPISLARCTSTWAWCRTPLNIKVLVICIKGCFAPVNFF